MILQSYPEVRQQLIDYYKIITKQPFSFVLPRELLLDDEQIEGRYQVDRVGMVRDDAFFVRPVDIALTIEKMIDVIPRMRTPTSVGLRHPEQDSIKIYTTIQEYIRLWGEMIKAFPNYGHPPVSQFYALEGVSSWLFETYSYYKKAQFIRSNDYTRDGKLADNMGNLINVLINNNFLTKEDSEENSFISYTDRLLDDKPSLKVDYNNWIFNGGN